MKKTILFLLTCGFAIAGYGQTRLTPQQVYVNQKTDAYTVEQQRERLRILNSVRPVLKEGNVVVEETGNQFDAQGGNSVDYNFVVEVTDNRFDAQGGDSVYYNFVVRLVNHLNAFCPTLNAMGRQSVSSYNDYYKPLYFIASGYFYFDGQKYVFDLSESDAKQIGIPDQLYEIFTQNALLSNQALETNRKNGVELEIAQGASSILFGSVFGFPQGLSMLKKWSEENRVAQIY